MTLRTVILVVFIEAIVLLAAVALLEDWCIDRRDYAPGYNTYRLVRCIDAPSYPAPHIRQLTP